MREREHVGTGAFARPAKAKPNRERGGSCRTLANLGWRFRVGRLRFAKAPVTTRDQRELTYEM